MSKAGGAFIAIGLLLLGVNWRYCDASFEAAYLERAVILRPMALSVGVVSCEEDNGLLNDLDDSTSFAGPFFAGFCRSTSVFVECLAVLVLVVGKFALDVCRGKESW